MENYQKWGLGISIICVIAGIIVLVLVLRYVLTFSHDLLSVRGRKYAKNLVYLHCRPSEHHEKLISISSTEITPRAPRGIKIVTSSPENQSNEIISRK